MDPPPVPLPDFDSLSLGTNNETDDILFYGLNHGVSPENALEFGRLRDVYQAAARAKMKQVFATGDASDSSIHDKRAAAADFFRMKREIAAQPEFEYLDHAIRRKEFDISPYEIAGKNTLDHPFPGATAAMDGIWPGYDHPQHFAEYPFLKKYGTLAAFLRRHNILFHLPETFARYGGVFVPHPYAGTELNIALRRHLDRCDPLFHTAPVVFGDTTKEEADLVLSYYEDDFVAVVLDARGEAVGIVGRQDMEGQNAKTHISDMMQQDVNEAPDWTMKPEEAFEEMDRRDWQYMVRMSPEHSPRIVTKTTASLSYFLPPFKHKEGLGSIAYFRISDIQESLQMLHRLQTETDGVAGAIVETAHADTEFVRKTFREFRRKLQDLFLMSGTVIDPHAVDEFMLWMREWEQDGRPFDDERQDADGMKIGIAEGRACRTSNTGVRLTNAYAGILCGAATWKEGTLVLDGWGYPDEFVIGTSINSVRARQGGGAIVARRESANPWVSNPRKDQCGQAPTQAAVKGKFYRGMAGADVQKLYLQQSALSLPKRMEVQAHLHSEGAEVFVPGRVPDTIGRTMLMCKFLLQSAMSYNGVRTEIKEKMLMQFQKNTTLHIVGRRTP